MEKMNLTSIIQALFMDAQTEVFEIGDSILAEVQETEME